MTKTKILGTGLNGLIGSRITELLADTYAFENVSRAQGVDITDKNQITDIILSSDAPIVLHMAAKADVDGCEQDKSLGKEGEAWRVNVTATEYVAQACVRSGKKLIYVSTDFVFDGENTPEYGYTEEDETHAINWYAQTKLHGEQVVQDAVSDFIIMRPAYPYRAFFEGKKDFVRAIKDRLAGNGTIKGVTDHVMCPVFIDDFVNAFDVLIQHNAKGVYHVVGSQAITPYEASSLIAEIFGYDKGLISTVTRGEFFQGRAPRPFNLTLNSGKIEALGVSMRTFQDGLQEVKAQT